MATGCSGPYISRMPYVANVPGYSGRDDRHGNPSRFECRVLLLVALEEAVPEIVADLRDTCGEAMARVLERCGPGDDPRHRTLLRALASARERVDSDSPWIDEPRSEAQADLYAALLEWATGNRLTDSDGRRNRWLLQHAVDYVRKPHDPEARDPHDPETLRGRGWAQLSTGLGRPSQTAREFRRRKHGPTPEGSELGPLARDFVWLVRYALTPTEPAATFAPGVPHDALLRGVRSAADRAGFDLPDPLRPTPSD